MQDPTSPERERLAKGAPSGVEGLPRAVGHETVLVAEDDAAVRRATCRMLHRLGYEVLARRDGRDALELATSHDGSIDLLLTDVVMPIMNGPELVTQLSEVRPDTSILYMSGHVGAAAFPLLADQQTTLVPKPFTVRDLALAVREALDR